MILTFRTNVVNGTLSSAPVSLSLISAARAVQEFVIWSPTSTLDISKSGFKLIDRSTQSQLIPEAGSWGQENFAAAGEFGWSPIPGIPLRLDMNEALLEGPPFTLILQIYNVAAAPILVAGFAIVREPYAEINAGDPYAFGTLAARPALVQAGASDMPLKAAPVRGEAPPSANQEKRS